MNLKDVTYNDLAFMSFGEAHAMKDQIKKLIEEKERLDDIIFDQTLELSLLKGEQEGL